MNNNSLIVCFLLTCASLVGAQPNEASVNSINTANKESTKTQQKLGSTIKTPKEEFSKADKPVFQKIPETDVSVSIPWGYNKKVNTDRLYPIVVNGCWGEGGYFTEDIRKKYPAFYLEYQKASDQAGANLADILDAGVKSGLRIDMNRVYLTGFSKGGSGSYKLVRGFLSKGKLFAAINRVAGQSESVLSDDAVKKTSIWYHIGTQDTPTRVQVADDAYDYVKNHEMSKGAVESIAKDTKTGFPRTTKTLSKNGVDFMIISIYDGMGHTPTPVYKDKDVFDWMFAQSLTN